MTAFIKLELIGDDFYWAMKHGGLDFDHWFRHAKRLAPDLGEPGVWRITGVDSAGKYRLQWLRSVRDYAHANSVGSRGVYAYYFLAPGLYYVVDRYAWKNIRRYVALVDANTWHKITDEEAAEWLKSTTSA